MILISKECNQDSWVNDEVVTSHLTYMNVCCSLGVPGDAGECRLQSPVLLSRSRLSPGERREQSGNSGRPGAFSEIMHRQWSRLLPDRCGGATDWGILRDKPFKLVSHKPHFLFMAFFKDSQVACKQLPCFILLLCVSYKPLTWIFISFF